MSETHAETPAVPAPPPRRWDWRPKVRWFAAEYLIVVLGVLTAVGINAWWQGRQDAASEQAYLTLVSRDLGQMVANTEELRDFETRQYEDALRAYRLLSAPTRSPEEQAEVSQIFSHLEDRRTMSIVDAAYEDLVSTGHLRLIRDLGLRDRIVTYFEEAERSVEIHNRNNWLYVDGMFTRDVYGRGLFFVRPGSNSLLEIPTAEALRGDLSGGYVEEPDPIWSRPPASDDWAVVKSHLLVRLQLASGEARAAESLLGRTRELKAEVDAELGQ